MNHLENLVLNQGFTKLAITIAPDHYYRRAAKMSPEEFRQAELDESTYGRVAGLSGVLGGIMGTGMGAVGGLASGGNLKRRALNALKFGLGGGALGAGGTAALSVPIHASTRHSLRNASEKELLQTQQMYRDVLKMVDEKNKGAK